MRRDDRDDPFDEFFRELERMMNDVMGEAGEFHVATGGSDQGSVHYDVHRDDGRIRVVADLPGADKSNIDLTCDGRTLTVDASGPSREYHERVSLPTTVDEHSATATYNNGVLEVAFEPAADSTSIDL